MKVTPSIATESGPSGRSRAPGASTTEGWRSSTSNTRSKLTIALITSTWTLERAVNGP